MKRLKASLTYSNVISTLCLFLLVGGGAAWAATQLPKNSIGPKQLKKGAVTAAKLGKGAVTPAKLSHSTKTALVGPAGPQGPQGPKGNPGAPGAPATALWAEISESGDVLKGSGVVGAGRVGPEGSYEVFFNRNVTACTYQVTSALYPGAVVLAELREKTTNGVYVETTESVGGTEFDSQFSLAVFC